MKDKKEGEQSAGWKVDKQIIAKVARIIDPKQRELYSQESNLLLRFLKIYPPIYTTTEALEMIWTFLKWLKSEGIYLVDKRTVFCFPFDRLVKLKNLKQGGE